MTPLEARTLELLRTWTAERKADWFRVSWPHKSARMKLDRWEQEADGLLQELEKAKASVE